MTASSVRSVQGPHFDELVVGQVFETAPRVTLTEGTQAVHGSIVGNRLHLALDAELAAEVTGQDRFAHPALVWDTSIGQSTVVTQHVRANLFYRGLSFRRFPSIGDTLKTVTTVEGLRENTRRPDRHPTGLAALHIVTTDQLGRAVLDYWRCAMLPLSTGDAPAGPKQDLDAIGGEPTASDVSAVVRDWRFDRFRERVSGPHFTDLRVGQTWEITGPDLVSGAPELARLTGNLATVHHDAATAGGRRLVYGGHTIGLALQQVTRALPAVMTVVRWHQCDHLAPVHEGDTLTSRVSIEDLTPLPVEGGLAELRVVVNASTPGAGDNAVLDWRCSAVFA